MAANSFSLDDQSFDQSEVVVKKPKGEKMINQYLMGGEIGQGVYGKVREALDTVSRERVAMKIIRKRRLTKIPRGLEHVREEIHILELLKQHPHQNVIRFIEHFEVPEKDKVYIVMGYVEGGTVEGLLKRSPSGRIPLGQARRLARGLLTGLHHLHLCNILHRDVKPDNLLLDLSGNLIVSDYGVAELVTNNEASGSAGSPAFHAPEIVRGVPRYVASKVDVWAAGVTLYFMILGTYPFNTASLAALIESTAAGTFELPPEIDPLTAALLRLLLEADADKRPDIPELLEHEWFTAELQSEADLEIVSSRSTLPTPIEPTPVKNDSAESRTNGSEKEKPRRGRCVIL